MGSPTERQVLDALKTVVDPDRRRDIVALNMVSGLTLKGGNVLVTIEVSPERGRAAEPIRQAAERAVMALPGVTSVTAVLTAEREAPQTPPTPPVRHGPASSRSGGQPLPPGIRAIVAVASGKGGVGKSTVSANLAIALQSLGLTIGLLDADIYGPSAPKLFGITGKPQTVDGKTLDPMRKFGLKVMSMGFLVPEDTPMIWRGPMVQSALQQMLRDVAWGDVDVLIVDMPPGTGDAQLTMAQQVPLAGAVIVSTPQDLALLDARKGLAMFRKVEVPVLGIIENMSYFHCPHCGGRTDIFGHGGARADAARLGVSFLGEVPLDPVIRSSSDAGLPVAATDPDGEHGRCFRGIADRVWDQVRPDAPVSARRPPPRIVYVD